MYKSDSVQFFLMMSPLGVLYLQIRMRQLFNSVQ